MVDHLYVHVPFCDGKCHYCAFYSIHADRATRRAYVAWPGRELALRAALAGWSEGVFAPRTVYFGGGTPGVLGADGLEALVVGLCRTVCLAKMQEWTVELSPTTATSDLLRRLRTSGVNRISIGAQCFDDDVLRAMGRRHTAADVAQAMRVAREAGFSNVGLDLIAGLPGVDAVRWSRSLARAMALAPEHLSVYALSIEPDSVLQRQVAAGLALPGADVQMDAIAEAETVLGTGGFLRYELSNYACDGYACQHNLACWRGEDFMGLGPSAASRIGCQRRTNDADVAVYGQSLADGRLPPAVIETLTATNDVSERFMTGLRLAEGVRPQAFAVRWPAAASCVDGWVKALARLAGIGVVTVDSAGTWRLTTRGREVADAVLRELL